MSGQTDWNDLANAEGKDAAKRQLVEGYERVLAANQVPESAHRDQNAARRGGGTAQEFPDFGDWRSDLTKTQTGAFAANIFNAKHVLENDKEWAGVLGYCDFSYRVMKRRPPPFDGGDLGEWTDADTDRLRIWMCKRYGFTPKTGDADGAVVVVAQANRFHPVRDYLDGLVWDKKPRVRQWLTTYLGVEPLGDEDSDRRRYDRYVSLVGTMWLVAAVARVMRPPVKADCVLILEGKQGLGKSTALAILGGQWFTDTHFALGEKDGYQQMQGVWLCELAELDAFNKAESTRAKQFFASEEDRYRPAYGRRTQAFARQCVFAGTTNQDNYLKDPTGNRRYWPVFCHRLDHQALARDRDQLWAEAVQLYRLNEPWWVQDHDKGLFEEQQEARYSADVWEDLIREWLADPVHSDDYYTTAAIMEGALHLEPSHMRQPEQTRVGMIMSRLGWTKRKKTITQRNGSTMRKWVYERPKAL